MAASPCRLLSWQPAVLWADAAAGDLHRPTVVVQFELFFLNELSSMDLRWGGSACESCSGLIGNLALRKRSRILIATPISPPIAMPRTPDGSHGPPKYGPNSIDPQNKPTGTGHNHHQGCRRILRISFGSMRPCYRAAELGGRTV